MSSVSCHNASEKLSHKHKYLNITKQRCITTVTTWKIPKWDCTGALGTNVVVKHLCIFHLMQSEWDNLTGNCARQKRCLISYFLYCNEHFPCDNKSSNDSCLGILGSCMCHAVLSIKRAPQIRVGINQSLEVLEWIIIVYKSQMMTLVEKIHTPCCIYTNIFAHAFVMKDRRYYRIIIEISFSKLRYLIYVW